ncbi:MAG TPA: Rieske 2Fe-2S domain-containing protein [Candidatus Kapabacteria bacterium]|nr:Rieske 2Fe-2S domain-containing protein [Candidatus Kapabacteria bacterium]
MAEEQNNSEQLADLPFLEVPRPEEAGTHPTSTTNMPPMKNAPEELKEVAAKASDPSSATARKADPPDKVRMAKPLPKQEDDPGTWEFGRRSFLRASGWMGFFGFITIATIGALRMMFPRTLYERPTVFKAGRPADYLPMSVSETYKDTERVWIIRDEDRIFALIAICTHLGCTPRWLEAENKFKCPCHGSGYTFEGVNFEGPAPRPMERAKISLTEDGQLLVDKGQSFRYELGQWDNPDAFIKV